MSKGKHYINNRKKLDALPDIDSHWTKALIKCREHIVIRLKKRTLFGAHSEERLGMDSVDYYISYAYDAIIDGTWEWKEGRTLAEQMIRIAENRIGKEVEKYEIEENPVQLTDNIESFFYTTDIPSEEMVLLREMEYAEKLAAIEVAIKDDSELENFWECIKEGMKREDIALFFEKTPKQIDKLREKFIKKTKSHLY